MKRDPADERAENVTPEVVLTRIQGEYLCDYAVFSGTLREYVVRALEAQYRSEPNDLHTRAFMLAVYREEYTAYEDLGAFLNAFLASRADGSPPLLHIIRYTAAQVRLSRVWERHEITTGEDLYNRLGLDDWMPPSWQEHYANVDLKKVLRRACFFFVEDCGPGQRDTGVSAFNKIKHGLVLVPEGRRYAPQLPSAPAILYATDPKDPAAEKNPITVLSIPTGPDKFEGRLRLIHFTQFGLRILAMLHVLHRHPDVLRRRGLPSDASVFSSERMVDVLRFMQKSSETSWTK